MLNQIGGIINPRLLSPTAWNMGAKSGLIWSVSAGLTTLYLFLRLPETKYVALALPLLPSLPAPHHALV
jgi:SP family general alpha glucoside:H+ symporter-like MFS transporter